MKKRSMLELPFSVVNFLQNGLLSQMNRNSNQGFRKNTQWASKIRPLKFFCGPKLNRENWQSVVGINHAWITDKVRIFLPNKNGTTGICPGIRDYWPASNKNLRYSFATWITYIIFHFIYLLSIFLVHTKKKLLI